MDLFLSQGTEPRGSQDRAQALGRGHLLPLSRGLRGQGPVGQPGRTPTVLPNRPLSSLLRDGGSCEEVTDLESCVNISLEWGERAFGGSS